MIVESHIEAPAFKDNARALAEAHSRIRTYLALLEAETAQTVLDLAAVSSIRMKLTHASRRRAEIIDNLLAACVRTRAEETIQVATMQAELRRARLASSGHISNWTSRTIAADWKGYCAASARLRDAIKQQIVAEARLVDWTARG